MARRQDVTTDADAAGQPRFRRPRYPMPPYIEAALKERGLMAAYQSRPPYQRNDYIGWITRAKRQETRDKRLAQMLDELADGDRYMNMAYNAKDGTAPMTDMTDIPALAQPVRGVTANGVPFVALPPEGGQEARGLIISWHGADPPRNEEALASALPMRNVPAWRVYLGLPLSGQRMPEGGFDEIMRRGAEDAVTLLFHPIITGAVSELPTAVNDLRGRLSIDAALPLGLFGFSMGGAAALLAVARHVLPFQAVVTWGAVLDMRALVDRLSSLYGVAYDWTAPRRDLAEEITVANRARALVESGADILLGIGSKDPYPGRELTEQLASAIKADGGVAEVKPLADVAHGFVAEPGDSAAPQGPQARAVDQMASQWFLRHLA
jgi:dienelactone hydrolase